MFCAHHWQEKREVFWREKQAKTLQKCVLLRGKQPSCQQLANLLFFSNWNTWLLNIKGKERAFRTDGRYETQDKTSFSWEPGSLLGLLLSQTMALRTTKETEVIDLILVDLWPRGFTLSRGWSVWLIKATISWLKMIFIIRKAPKD